MLYIRIYAHADQSDDKCVSCDASKIVHRPRRGQETFIFHSGRIATGNSVIKDGVERDRISKDTNGAICFEMEAAGVVLSGGRCLVIRGIANYADSHKNDKWKCYAAAKAAVFAAEILHTIDRVVIEDVEAETKIGELLGKFWAMSH